MNEGIHPGPRHLDFPLLFAFVVGGLGFELCVFVAGWRHALRSEWPFIIIIIIIIRHQDSPRPDP